MKTMDAFALSVCICTRNRHLELTNALKSLLLSKEFIHEVIVSDDSTNDETYYSVKNVSNDIKYVRGPRKGLSANRNNALDLVTGTHVLFIDDDVIVDPDFIPNIIKYHANIAPHRRNFVIITGLEKNRGNLIYPHEQSFLGFQKREYPGGAKIRTIVINSTVFPIAVFDQIKFDEQLIYGYEEVDVATRASYSRFDIELCTDAINSHYPSGINRDFYRPYLHASRLYVTFKRYMCSEKRPLKAILFLATAMNHLIVSLLVHQGFSGVWNGVRATRLALKYIGRILLSGD